MVLMYKTQLTCERTLKAIESIIAVYRGKYNHLYKIGIINNIQYEMENALLDVVQNTVDRERRIRGEFE